MFLESKLRPLLADWRGAAGRGDLEQRPRRSRSLDRLYSPFSNRRISVTVLSLLLLSLIVHVALNTFIHSDTILPVCTPIMRNILSSISSLGIAALSLPLLLFSNPALCAWPDTPFTTNGRDIVSASGQNVVYAGVNWPGAADTMLPEGLQFNSIANIVSMVKSLGMNAIRLTYAIEMIDDIESNSPDQTLQSTLVNALGAENGTAVFQQIIENNPTFTEDTTRLDVFDAVAAECAAQQIWVHLDNHVSKAIWCCNHTDGNAWFGDTYFDVSKWQRGLGYMADHAKSWPALASTSLRNELRQPEGSGNASAAPYDWVSWYQNTVPAANGIYGNNSLPLIFFSGLNYDVDNSALINGSDLGNGLHFTSSDFAFADKVVFEVHDYQNDATSCDDIEPILYQNAYGAMNLTDVTYPNKAPVVLTEFGFDQTDGSDRGPYAQCLQDLVTGQPGGPGGWTQWVLAGSYYIRQGRQDDDESWGKYTFSACEMKHSDEHFRTAQP